MAVLRDLRQMLGQLQPRQRPGRYVFTTVGSVPPAGVRPVMTFTEDEGLTVIISQDEADAARLAYDLVTEWITLTVSSALDGVGLTAAVSAALTRAGISCNVVAATHHDHLFVSAGRAAEAVAILGELASRNR